MDAAGAIVERCRERVEDASFGFVQAWKRDHPGAKVVGYFPVYFPSELAHAAGMLPLAIFGGGNRITLKQADAHMYSFMCSICKSTLELALSHRLAALDLFVGTPICDAARHMPGLMERNQDGLAIDILYLPGNLRTELAVPYLARELQRLRELLQSIAGRPITDDALRASIAQYNEWRSLVNRLYALRRRAPWQLSAVECYAVVRAGSLMSVDEHLPLLRDFVAAVEARRARSLDKIRVVYEGGFCEQPPLAYIGAIEEACYIVDDDFAVGTRLIDGDIDASGDPLLALARAYRDHSACTPVQHDMRRAKSDALLAKFRAAGAQALLLGPAKFCEPGLDDQVHHLKRAESEGIPCLQMEFQERMKDFDGVRTQTETFAEALLFYAD
ncbi:MAG: 2-hydroxyacyl-CoA dehydratase [Burkholderiaceae bacterium]